MKNEFEEIEKELLSQRKKADRKNVSFYLSQKIVRQFKHACGSISYSRVIEMLLERYAQNKSDELFKASKAQKEVLK
jgi:Mg2+ and Co2+ transporter CorA